jgi:trans-aconitate methyltransferase
MAPEGFERYTCTTTDVNRQRMTEIVVRHVSHDLPIRILDVGCGTGAQLLALLDALPRATGTGVDISPPNIDEARHVAARSPIAARLTFVCADYFTHRLDAADAIVSDNTLHLVPGDTAEIFAKLASDLSPRALLIVVMPSASAFNTLLFTVRRMLRAVRSRATDNAILALGRLLHPAMSAEMLRERIHYMYRVPERIMTDALKASLEKVHGLSVVAEYAYPHSSLAQPKHVVTVFQQRS